MKKLILAALISGGFAVSAQAQSNVTVYGLADAGFVNERGGAAGSVNKITSGVGSASRLGFRGNEDLGNGLSAIFTAEMGFLIDTGAADSSGQLFNRQSFVGLKSKDLGTLTLGRQYTPLYLTLGQVADPFGTGYAGTSKNLFATAGSLTRSSNTIYYLSPTISGFFADLAYSLGEQAGDNSAGRQWGGSVGYSNGPLNARFAFNGRNNNTAANPITGVKAATPGVGHNSLFAINYDFQVVKAFFAFESDKGYLSSPIPNATAYLNSIKPVASTDASDVLVGLTAPIGAGNLVASYIRKNDKTIYNQDAHQWALGYLYSLSKRSTVYVAYGAITNENGASYTVGGNTETGSGNKAFNLGVRHTF